MKRTIKLAAGVSLAVMALATSVRAQTGDTTTAPAQASDPAAPQGGLTEVVVTAQRRSQNLQHVPISVTSFTPDTLASKQIVDTLDLGREVPNMSASNGVGQGSANVYYIRALGQTQAFPTFEPQVGTYVDDIYIARENANNFALFGVSQLQVLNGPQGTLFGRNSTGGAIVVTLEKPGKEFGGDADLSYGSYDQFSGHVSVNMPVNDQVLTRTSIFGITNDGYVQDITTHQTLNATHDWGAREAITILPKNLSNVEWNLSVDYEHNDAANLLNQPSANGGANGSDRIAYSGFSTEGGALEPYLTGAKAGFGQGAVVESYGFASNIKMQFSSGTLNFITGFRGLDQDLAADYPAASLGPLTVSDVGPTGGIVLAQALRSAQYSQEIKWNGQVGDWLNYTAGAFYLYETNRNNYGQVLGLGAGAPSLTLNDQFDQNHTVSDAVYAQGDFKLTPKLTLTIGGRFTHEIKEVSAEANQPGLGYDTAQIQAAGIPTHLNTNQFTPRAALQYQLDPQVMLFASATRGFQGGGWNGLTGSNPQDFNAFKPETIWSYETGFRSETRDHRLRFNTTFFYENVHNYQLLSDNPFTDSFDTSNAANLAAYGLESQVVWRPVDDLTLSANVSAMRAIYFDQSQLIKSQQTSCLAGVAGTCDSGIVRANGNLAQPIFAPPFQASTSAAYDFRFNGFTLTPLLAVQFVAREWFDSANTDGAASSYPTLAGGENKPRTLIDFGVTYAPSNMPFTITAECKNCTMVNYGVTNLLGVDYFNPPGTWDVRLHYKF